MAFWLAAARFRGRRPPPTRTGAPPPRTAFRRSTRRDAGTSPSPARRRRARPRRPGSAGARGEGAGQADRREGALGRLGDGRVGNGRLGPRARASQVDPRHEAEGVDVDGAATSREPRRDPDVPVRNRASAAANSILPLPELPGARRTPRSPRPAARRERMLPHPRARRPCTRRSPRWRSRWRRRSPPPRRAAAGPSMARSLPRPSRRQFTTPASSGRPPRGPPGSASPPRRCRTSGARPSGRSASSRPPCGADRCRGPATAP